MRLRGDGREVSRGSETKAATLTAFYLRASTEDKDLTRDERELSVKGGRHGWEAGKIHAKKVCGTGNAERRDRDRLLVGALDGF